MPQRPRRTREEITYEILMALSVTEGARITRIMQKTRLNYYQAKNYLKQMMDKRYIVEKNGIYILIDHGRQFIKQYKALKNINYV